MSGTNALKQLPLLPIFTFEKPINPTGVTFHNPKAGIQDQYHLRGSDDIEKLLLAKPQTISNRLIFWGETKPDSSKAKLFLKEARLRIPQTMERIKATMDMVYANELMFAVSNWMTYAHKNEDIREIIINLLLEDDKTSYQLLKAIKGIELDGEIESVRKATREFIERAAPRVEELHSHLVHVRLAEKHNVRRDMFGFEAVAEFREVVHMLDRALKGRSNGYSSEKPGAKLDTNVIPFVGGMVETYIKGNRKYIQDFMNGRSDRSLAARYSKELFSRFAYAESCEDITEEELSIWLNLQQLGLDEHTHAWMIDKIMEALAYLSRETPYATNALIWFADQGNESAEFLVRELPFDLDLLQEYGRISAQAFINLGESGETDPHEREKAIVPIRVIKRLAEYGNIAAALYFAELVSTIMEGVNRGDIGAIAIFRNFHRAGIL